jgi:hypothetical protein
MTEGKYERKIKKGERDRETKIKRLKYLQERQYVQAKWIAGGVNIDVYR